MWEVLRLLLLNYAVHNFCGALECLQISSCDIWKDKNYFQQLCGFKTLFIHRIMWNLSELICTKVYFFCFTNLSASWCVRMRNALINLKSQWHYSQKICHPHHPHSSHIMEIIQHEVFWRKWRKWIFWLRMKKRKRSFYFEYDGCKRWRLIEGQTYAWSLCLWSIRIARPF